MSGATQQAPTSPPVTDPGLDEDQAKAATAPGHCLVSAGPGSGKTRLLAARGGRLLNEDDHRIAAVTFTRDAARELRERIRAAGPPGSGKRVLAGTFHSLALRQLKEANQGPRRIASGSERRNLIRDAIKESGLSGLSLEEAEAQIDALKADPAPPPDETESMPGRLHAAYAKALRRAGMMDFADLLRTVLNGMKQGSLPPLPVAHILVDEGQDMDLVQYEWLQFHWRAGVLVTYVGDDDQSIYGWRQALGGTGFRSSKEATDAQGVDRGTNYRCRPDILRPAIRLIEHSPDRLQKSLRSQRPEGGQVQVVDGGTRAAEAHKAAETIPFYGEPHQWAVLARTKRLLDSVELALMAEGIPVKRPGGASFWETIGPATLLSLLRSMTDDHPAGVVSALRFAGGRPPPSVEHPGSATEALHQATAGGSEDSETKIAQDLADRFPEWRALVTGKQGRAALAIRAAARWLAKHADSRAETIESAGGVLAKLQGTLLQRLAFVGKSNESSGEENVEPAVILTTLHGSKGLEWDYVWLFGFEEGLLPHDESPVDEERRLAYVGMTRAREGLFISFSPHEGSPSRFLGEAGLR